MSLEPIELARQRASEAPSTGVVVTPVSTPGRRESTTDWAELRGVSDPNGDGGISTIALPPMASDIDDGGLGSDTHPSNPPIKKLLAQPMNELSEEDRKMVFDYLLDKERQRSDERDNLALEQEKFTFEKKKTAFGMMKTFAVGFGVLAALAFTAIVAVLIWVSIKNTNFGDTSILPAILNTFTQFFNILVNM